MRNLYWKIFLSFWSATIVIIFTTTWVITHITKDASIPAQEQLFMDSYANAAVAIYESAQQKNFLSWMKKIGDSRHMTLFLLSGNDTVIHAQNIPNKVRSNAKLLLQIDSHKGILKSGNLIISHEIKSDSGIIYRLAALSNRPITHLVTIPWYGLTIRLLLAICTSGLICYLLSLYLTRPLRSLKLAAQSLATGNFNTRVGYLRGHQKDEIAQLSAEFDRMAEQLETLVLSKERLLQDISHELRSPLARLQIAIELGRSKTTGLASAEFARMDLECKRLNALIGEILDFARLNRSIQELQLQDVDIAELIQEIIDDANYEDAQTEKNLKRVCSYITSPTMMLADRKLIHRAIENIVRNALHYSPRTEPILIELQNPIEPNSICITITDKGPGVPSNQLEKIFNPFYRVDLSRTKKTGGFGLGLAIASKSIKLHGGTITAINLANGGFRVIITCKKY